MNRNICRSEPTDFIPTQDSGTLCTLISSISNSYIYIHVYMNIYIYT